MAAVFLCAEACHKPEYVRPTAERQGLTSLTAIIMSGPYEGQELARLNISDPEAERLEIPLPFYYPEASDDETLVYMTGVRVQAELQPNYIISPKLGVLDLTEENWFTLTDPDGNSRKICITGKRYKPTACTLLSIMVEDVKTSGVIYEGDGSILIPYLDDLSAVSISGQVSPHARISKVNGKDYSESAKYNMNSGATITVLAGDGKTSRTYKISQGIPELLSQGVREESVALLSSVDPVSGTGLPPYTDLCYVSLAGVGTTIVVGLGEGRSPVLVDAFTGRKKGELNLGTAVADCLTNDDAGHLLIANYAEGGDNAGVVNIYKSGDLAGLPELWYSFTNPLLFPIGHRIKAIGDIAGDAAIVFTSEGIAGVSVSSTAVALIVRGGAVSEVLTIDFAGNGLAWGAAPVNFATVVPASVNPQNDGWFIDYYEGNSDPSVAHGTADCYILHHIDKNSKDSWLDLVGNWAVNPNCLDIKTFNGARYLALMAVSHFPEWDIKPRLRLYDASSPKNTRLLLKNDEPNIFQKGATNADFGAAGDIALVPSTDGYRLYLYYYDHHAHAIGAYVADCFEI